MNHLEKTDDAVMLELANLLSQHDPLPELVVTAAQMSYTIASPWDAALAQLIYDSSNDDDARALVRGPVARELTFEGPALTVEMEVSSTDPIRQGRCRILGQLVPAQSTKIEVRHPAGNVLVDADALGRFAVNDAPTGPLSLRCNPANGEPTDTEWTVI